MKLKNIVASVNLQSEILKISQSNNSKLLLSFENHNKKAFTKIQESFQEKLQEKQLDLAIVGDKGEVLYKKDDKGNDAGFLFSKESTKELNRFVKEEQDKDYLFDFFKTKYSQLTELEKNTIDKVLGNSDILEYCSNFISEIPEVLEEVNAMTNLKDE